MRRRTIVWAPPGSEGSIGAVRLKIPMDQPLTLTDYRFLMADRINRLIAKESPEYARALLKEVGRNEPIDPDEYLAMAGELLAENSEWLFLRSGAGSLPVPVEQMKHNPIFALALREETLETFLLDLYSSR